MFLGVDVAAVSHIPTYQHVVISAATPLCKSWRLTRRLAWHLFTQDHAMPPWSTNRSTMQLLTKRMPLILKPGTHKQMPVPTPSLMRRLVLSLGTRDEKRGMTERKNWMLPPLAASQGFWYRISVLSQGGDRHGERAREEKGKGRKESEQYGHACCLLVYLSSPSTLQQLTQQQEDSFPLKWDISQHRGRSLYVQLHASPAKAHCPIPGWSDWLFF